MALGAASDWQNRIVVHSELRFVFEFLKVIVLFFRKLFCVSNLVGLMGELYSDIGTESISCSIYSERILQIVKKGQKHWGKHDRTFERSETYTRRFANDSLRTCQKVGSARRTADEAPDGHGSDRNQGQAERADRGNEESNAYERSE